MLGSFKSLQERHRKEGQHPNPHHCRHNKNWPLISDYAIFHNKDNLLQYLILTLSNKSTKVLLSVTALDTVSAFDNVTQLTLKALIAVIVHSTSVVHTCRKAEQLTQPSCNESLHFAADIFIKVFSPPRSGFSRALK